MANQELCNNLLAVNVNQPNEDLTELFTQLNEAIDSPGDISCLIGPVVKLLPCHHHHVKKAIYGVFPRLCSRIPEAALLAVNTILKDADDPNPAVQVLALGLLGCVPTLGPHADLPLCKALSHSHPLVRRAAVSSAAQIQPGPLLTRASGHQLIDRLYESVRDDDPCVVTGALLALDALLVGEGGVVVRRQMAAHLLSRLDSFPPLQLASVLQVLCKYKPKDEEELFSELSSLDKYLQHPCGPVVVSCAQLFLALLADGHPHLEDDLIKRAFPALRGFISSGGPVARHIISFLLEQRKEWLLSFSNSSEDISLFHPTHLDQAELALEKMKILPRLCHSTEECQIAVVAIESWWVKSGNRKTEKLKEGVYTCMHKLAENVPDAAIHCLDALLKFLDFEVDTHVAKGLSSSLIPWRGILNAILKIGPSRFGQDVVSSTMSKVLEGLDITDVNLPEVIPALMAECGYMLEEGPYILDVMIDNFSNYGDGTQHLILSAAMVLFLHRPVCCQQILGRLLEKCLSESNGSSSKKLHSMGIICRAQQYYLLLKADVNLFEKILPSVS
ncbi:AP-4 complex subunit beta-1-like [Ischnura elegans]|uniref:AP-4 complex subunit beta-1-like n=1 Tax=Ischnura elegans TaxID=197161 RepID=UPI001ED8B978|nr:AP-4 complex subunit beta-1-like [Ischnura elegans]